MPVFWASISLVGCAGFLGTAGFADFDVGSPY
jgi:hypothetical protein